MDGRFEDYTLGRNISVERVKEIYRLFKKHQFQIADLRSFDEVVTAKQFAQKRQLAAELKADQARFVQLQAETSAALAKIPIQAKGGEISPQKQRWHHRRHCRRRWRPRPPALEPPPLVHVCHVERSETSL